MLVGLVLTLDVVVFALYIVLSCPVLPECSCNATLVQCHGVVVVRFVAAKVDVNASVNVKCEGECKYTCSCRCCCQALVCYCIVLVSGYLLIGRRVYP